MCHRAVGACAPVWGCVCTRVSVWGVCSSLSESVCVPRRARAFWRKELQIIPNASGEQDRAGQTSWHLSPCFLCEFFTMHNFHTLEDKEQNNVVSRSVFYTP